MTRRANTYKSLLAILVCSVTSTLAAQMSPASPLAEQAQKLDGLYSQLRDPALEDWQRVEDQIRREWAKSGSASIDLLLARGQDALENGDVAAAIEHLTALTDHAPDFAEGWNARATAFYQAEEFGLAIADIQRVLALVPQHFGALAGFATILEALDKREQALAVWQQVRTIHPHRPNVEEAITRLTQELGGTDL